MLGHGYWQRAFGADPQVVGRTLRMGGRPYTIIGIVRKQNLIKRQLQDCGY